MLEDEELDDGCVSSYINFSAAETTPSLFVSAGSVLEELEPVPSLFSELEPDLLAAAPPMPPGAPPIPGGGAPPDGPPAEPGPPEPPCALPLPCAARAWVSPCANIDESSSTLSDWSPF